MTQLSTYLANASSTAAQWPHYSVTNMKPGTLLQNFTRSLHLSRRWLSGPTSICIAWITITACASTVLAAPSSDSAAEKEGALISLLRSNTPPADKAIACKQLAIYGSAKAVPALAALLSDESLASWARIALEAIPGPEPDAAFRQAMIKLHGRLLVGTINSIGVRRDAKAIGGLTSKLKEPDENVASAAAVALGRIGGVEAAEPLKESLARTPPAVRLAVAEGCLRCAETLVTAGKQSAAVDLYEAVRKADVPHYRQLEGTRGAILVQGSTALPVLLELMRSPDKGDFAMALRTARELPGTTVTDALVNEMKAANPERQPLILLALADRGDAAALPAVLDAARTGPKKVRLAAVAVLEYLSGPSNLPVLLQLAADTDPDLSRAAITVLTRLPGKDVDSVLLERLPMSEGKQRAAIIELAGQRRIEAAIPLIVTTANASDAQVRSASLKTIGLIGGDAEIPKLIALLQKTPSQDQRAEIEAALVSISGRRGAGCVQPLLSLAHAEDSSMRIAALQALAAAGGAEALAAVKEALADKDEAVQDEAVRTISSWPNTWPDDDAVAEPLLTLARSSQKKSHQVLALRGYLQFVQGDKKLNDNDRLNRISDVMPLLERPEEKRLAIAALRTIHTADSLNALTAFAKDSAVADEACSAVMDIAGKKSNSVSRNVRQKALQTVVDNSSDEATRKRAQNILSGLQR
jgi:HEAT repeat protein